MRTITKAEMDRYAKYCTGTERNEIEERHRAGLCDAWCAVCQAEIDNITAWVLREGMITAGVDRGICAKCGLAKCTCDDQKCPRCGSTSFTRDGDRERCAECGL
jgi:hypothetical protein